MKRGVDICIAVMSLPVIGLAFVVAGLAIKLTSPGPILFRQTRVGRSEAEFVCLKFRTMRDGTADLPTHEVDARAITPLGGWLRRHKLDELPQIWNVLKGEMSFVGPRPCLPSQTALIDARRRHNVFSVRPGITGLAQIRGVDMSDPERLAMIDADYVAHRTLRGDLRLMMQSVLGAGQGDRVRRK